jgi:hypothetical protein
MSHPPEHQGEDFLERLEEIQRRFQERHEARMQFYDNPFDENNNEVPPPPPVNANNLQNPPN